jgi:hypothetical protein
MGAQRTNNPGFDVIFIGVTGTIALFSAGDIIVSPTTRRHQEEELSMLDVFVTVNAGESQRYCLSGSLT